MNTKTVETIWANLCYEAGWTAELNCSPNLRQVQAYYARLDAIIGERQDALRALIGNARKTAEGFDRHYLDGIEGAIERAIASPRLAA
jgi:hypothetical protein